MRGILIIGFNKSPGAYIDNQYPEDITEKMNVNTADLMNVYALHRMRQMQPNYITLKIKNVPIVSFYSGFSFKHYVGKPDFAITIILSPEDNPNEDYEGMLRRIAFELLPRRDSLEFDDMLFEYFEDLKEKNLEPYFEEYKEGEGSSIATISDESFSEEDEVKKLAKEGLKVDELSFDKQFEQMEKWELKGELEELKKQLTEKNGKIRELSQAINEKLGVANVANKAEVLRVREELSEKNNKLDEWGAKLADLSEKNYILMETVRKLTEMSTMQTEEMEVYGQQVISLEKKLGEKEKLIEEISNNFLEVKSELDRIKSSAVGTSRPESSGLESSGLEVSSSQEVKTVSFSVTKPSEDDSTESFLDAKTRYVETITQLKTKVKKKDRERRELDSTIGILKKEIINLKKDNKIFRRESEHYKEIVKEHDLLD